jgi:cytochrome b6-f complex subunit 7
VWQALAIKTGDIKAMGGEIFTTAVLVFGMILVGLSVGFLLLKVQGGEG